MRRRAGQSDVLSTVILITVIMVLSAIFMVFSMVQFGNEVSQSSIGYVVSFLTNVADDVDTFMFVPGAVLTYQLPNTNYGTYNFIESANANCTVLVYTGLNQKLIDVASGELIYGVPPNYFSLPPGEYSVWRGSTINGIPTSSFNDFSLIVSYKSSVLMGTSMAVLQFGYGNIDGINYGTYIVLVPRVMIINGTGPNGISYVYIPVLNLISDQGRSKLIISIRNISSQSVILNNGEVKVSEICYLGSYYGGDNYIKSSVVTVVGSTMYVTIVQIGIGFG